MNIQKVDYKSINCPRDFSASLRETGFSVLHNHPIDIALIEKVYSEWVKFFESDFKHDYLFSEDGQDGYFPFKTENAKGAPQKDLKEFFHVYDWGKFPKELSNATLDLQSQLITLTSTLLNWIQVETPDEVTELFSVPLPKMIENSKTNLLRVIHYPPLDGSEEEGAIRGAAHEDINLIISKKEFEKSKQWEIGFINDKKENIFINEYKEFKRINSNERSDKILLRKNSPFNIS